MDAAADHRRILDSFPAIYRQLLPEFFEQHVPEESLATCHACAMCTPNEGGAALGSAGFNLGTKCCSFHPALPNYLVGGILADSGDDLAEGRDRIRAQLRRGVECWPLGLTVPGVYSLLYDRKGPDVFGTARSIQCPYFREGEYGCTIWRHRNATCSTWFCKHVKGQDGREFWMAVKAYVGHLEAILPAYFALELGLDPAATPIPDPASPLSRHQIDGTVDPGAHARAWGAWHGREEAYFLECHRRASALDRGAVADIIGRFQQRLQQPRLERSYRQMMTPELPDPLLRNPDLVVYPRPDDQRLVTSVAGSFRVAGDVLDMLWAFDGVRGTAEVAELLRAKHDVEISPALLVRFYQNRFLVAPPPA